ncbi:MAG: autoinducer-2 kinase [Treponema sp.]|jgi:autoinducer 2 (AI-2) kinase|nr:autoinducer-2 kinase [Treponema sp.]
MSNTWLMAVDAGTGSVRAVIFDKDGAQKGCVQREWKHLEDPRFPGSMDFDWNTNWGLVCACVSGVLEETGIAAAEIAAVSTTCMREGIILYDAAGGEIWACANVDARSNDETGELKALDRNLEKEIYHLSGQTFALGALPRLLWVKNKMPDLYKRTARVGMFNDWIIYRLSGILAVEPSNGSTTGIFNLRSRNWDTGIARRCGLREDIFPPVTECGTAVAKVSARGASESGLLQGTPLVSGGGDSQLGCVGLGVTAPDEAAVLGGSFWQYEYNTGEAKTSGRCDIRVNCHAIDGVWQYEAIAFNPGLVMRWYRDAFCQEEKRDAENPYEIMDREAAKIPAGSFGIFCAFSDVMNYISWRHAAPTFGNFTLSSGQSNKYSFYRAIMENAALVTRGHLELVERAAGKRPKKVIFAGGAAKSALWAQILCDVLGVPVQTPVVKEATALGAALLAGTGIGLYPDIKTAARLVKMETEFVPDGERRRIYRDAYEKWRVFYAAQLELSGKKITAPMWSAPGL